MSLGGGAVLRAIETRWTAMKLDTTITGGLHLGTAPKLDRVPYCVLNVVAETIVERTSSGNHVFHEYSRMLLDFTLWGKGGMLSVERYADLVRQQFDNVSLVLQTGEGKILYFRWVNSIPLQHPDNPSVWSYTVSYDVLRHRQEVVN